MTTPDTPARRPHTIVAELDDTESCILALALLGPAEMIEQGRWDESWVRAYYSLWNKICPSSCSGFSQLRVDESVAQLDAKGLIRRD